MNVLDENKSNHDTKAQHKPRTLGLQDVTLLVTLVIIAGFVRFGNITEQSTSSEQSASNFPSLISTSEVVANKDEFIGKTLTVRSNPVQKVGLSSFTINDRAGIFQEPILVVNASGAPFDLPTNRNRKVEVTGEVRNLVIPELERDFNLNLEEEQYREFINRPTIIAQSIKLLD
jgi:hypothetical protein